MKVAIVGSRTITDYNMIENVVIAFQTNEGQITEIVSGGARGVDTLAEKLANRHNIPIKVFPADWDAYGKSAGYRRNRDIVDRADVVFAFWDGKSKGTKHSIDLAKEKGKRLEIITAI